MNGLNPRNSFIGLFLRQPASPVGPFRLRPYSQKARPSPTRSLTALPLSGVWVLALLAGLSTLGLSTANAANRLQARIVDDATGQPLAARVALTNAEGRFVEIEGKHEHVQYLEKRWCYVDGSFSTTIPPEGIGIEIRRGFETRPLLATVTPNATDKPREFRLRRWSNLASKGWINGDIHAHLPIPKAAYPQMRAEDLNALSLLHMADQDDPIAINDCFLGGLDPISTPGAEIYVGQEIRDFQMGHLTLLKLTGLVPGYPDMGGGMEFWKVKPHWDLLPAPRAARAQNGVVFWSHICSLPGEQLPVALALGLVDGVELITWNDPTTFPNHLEPWQWSGMSQAEFPVMCAVDLYYQFLNAGFRLPIGAGTDKFGEEIPLGSNRTFALVNGAPSYASWLAAVKSGRSFVSNGPILDFKADGFDPGDVINFKGTRDVTTKVKARSILPFNMLEIVLNGEPVGHRVTPIWSNSPVDGVYSMELTTTVKLDRSGWLAARVMDNPDLRSPILPRRVSVFAHSSPVYFLREGKKVREEASIVYLRKYVEGMLHWLGTRPKFVHEEDLFNARAAAEEALQYYRTL